MCVSIISACSASVQSNSPGVGSPAFSDPNVLLTKDKCDTFANNIANFFVFAKGATDGYVIFDLGSVKPLGEVQITNSKDWDWSE